MLELNLRLLLCLLLPSLLWQAHLLPLLYPEVILLSEPTQLQAASTLMIPGDKSYKIVIHMRINAISGKREKMETELTCIARCAMIWLHPLYAVASKEDSKVLDLHTSCALQYTTFPDKRPRA